MSGYVSDEKFQTTVIAAVLQHETLAIARHLRVSVPTIERWAEGKNLAHPAMREGVLRALAEMTPETGPNLLLEAVADIAYEAGSRGWYSGNSRDDMQSFIAWAQEFETHRTEDKDGNECYFGETYMIAIEDFAMKKLAEHPEHMDSLLSPPEVLPAPEGEGERFTPSEACAYALAMLENTRTGDPMESFIYREACGVLEEAGVRVSVERPFPDSTQYQAEVCSPAACTGRQALALVGVHEKQGMALIEALRSVFHPSRY